MPLPEEVYRRLAARAATDLDVASMLATFANPAEDVSEPPLDQARMQKRPRSEGSQ